MDTEHLQRRQGMNWPRIVSLLVPIALLLSMFPTQPPAAAQMSLAPALAGSAAIAPAALSAQPTPNPATLPSASAPVPAPGAYDSAHNCAPSASGWTRFVGSGVNAVCGSFVAQSLDLQVAGRGLPFAFVRTYNSGNPGDGPLGFGWTDSYNISFTVESPTSVVVRGPDGRLDRFTLNGGSYTPPPGVFSTLSDNGDGTFTLKERDQTRYRFDASGHLTSIADRNDNTLTLAYTSAAFVLVQGSASLQDTRDFIFKYGGSPQSGW
jgi:YD repeat-containing protein